MKQASKIIIFGGVGLLLTGVAVAQAPPGPIAPVASQRSSSEPPPPPPVKIVPRTNILGAWKLNRDESDDPKARSNQRKVNDPNQGHGGNSGPHIGFPGGGMGGPGMGGGQRGNGGSQKDTTEDRQRYAELIDPSIRLKLERKNEKDPIVEMFGDQGRKTIFYTDGHKPDAPAGVGTDVVEAKWDGEKLVSSSPLPKKGSLTRTYEVSPDGLQLWEEVEMVIGKDKNPSRFRFVYDAVAREE
ncbi:MAG TPA: hypothetical protein VNY24_08570 [Candidatus Acidoferrales bacterium]|jgi:hypothetical protein|nr:hypothetical protein [Candidatus Acidoferrales bacterium]